MRTDRAPGPLLRLTIVAARGGVRLVVASAALELGRAHWGAALVALPLLVAVLVAALVAYPRLVWPAAAAVLAMLLAIATGGLVAWADADWSLALHVAAAGGALAASLVTLAASLRGEPLPFGPWRDYVTLTKPRIMSLLLLTGAAGMFVGAGGWPGGVELATMLLGLALACGGASALNHVMDATSTGSWASGRPPPGRLRPRPGAARARVRPRALGALVRASRDHGQRAHGRARARRQPLLRRRLHRLPEALDRPEHRHRRRRRCRAAARRLRGRDGQRSPCPPCGSSSSSSSGRRRTSGRSR